MGGSDEKTLRGLVPIAEKMGTTAADLLAGLRAESAEQRPAPAVTLALSGLPDSCPHCGEEPHGGQWDLLVLGGLQVSCPVCFTVVAPVHAVAAEDPECE